MERTSEMLATEAQIRLFRLLRSPKSPEIHEILAAVNSVFTTADLAKNKPVAVKPASELFSAKNPVLCRDVAEDVEKALHGDRHYSHLPWVKDAYNIVLEAGKQFDFAMLTAEECEQALLKMA